MARKLVLIRFFLPVVLLASLLALGSADSIVVGKETPVQTGYLRQNLGQLRNSAGFPADSVLAYGRFPGGWLFVTGQAVYFSRVNNSVIVRSGCRFPGTRVAQVKFEEDPECSFVVAAGKNILRPKTIRSVEFTALDDAYIISVDLHRNSATLSLRSLTPAGLARAAIIPENVSRSLTRNGGVEWLDATGAPLFEESMLLNGLAVSNANRVSHSDFLPAARIIEGNTTASKGTAMQSPDLSPETQEITLLLRASTFLGAAGQDSVLFTANYASGIVLCGSTTSAAFPCTPGVSQSSLKGSKDAWVASYSAEGRPLWVTYFGGNGDDAAYGCAVAGSNVVVTGVTTSTDIGTAGTYQPTFQGGTSDAFVAGFSLASGLRSFCSYFGGAESDEGRAVCFLPNGDIALCGSTYSTTLAMDAHQTQLSGGQDAFAAVFNSSMTTRRWGTYYGGRADDEGRGIGGLEDGSIVLAGNTSSPNSGFRIAENVGQGGSPPGGLQTSGFVAKLTAAGARSWGRYLGGDSYDTVTCLQTSGNSIYIGGHTASQSGGANNFISGGSAQSSSGSGQNDGFVSKLGADGNIIWGTFIGGAKDDRVYGVTVSPTTDVIICGTTNSDNFPTVQSDQTALAGGYDAFVAYVLKSGLSFGRALLIGGSSDDAAVGSSFMSDRTVLVAGSTASASFPVSQASQPAIGGGLDAFVCLFEPLYTVGIESDQTEQHTLRPSPMPVSNTLEVSAETPVMAPSSVRCIAANGTTVFQKILTETLHSTTLDVSSLPAGMYTVIWSNATRSVSSCIIKVVP
jgi:hypothetical protein